MPKSETFSSSESAYVLGWSRAKLTRLGGGFADKVIEKKTVKAIAKNAGKREAVSLSYSKSLLRALYVTKQFGEGLSPEGRKSMVVAIKRLPLNKTSVAVGRVVIDLSPADADLTVAIGALRTADTAIVRDGNDAFFAGTDISAYRVAALTGTANEVQADYPSLTIAQIEQARQYAKAHKKPGAPYPAKSMKRHLTEMANFGIFDTDEVAAEASDAKAGA